MAPDKAKSLLTLLIKAARSRRHMASRSTLFYTAKIEIIFFFLTEESLLRWVVLVNKVSFVVKCQVGNIYSELVNLFQITLKCGKKKWALSKWKESLLCFFPPDVNPISVFIGWWTFLNDWVINMHAFFTYEKSKLSVGIWKEFNGRNFIMEYLEKP